MGWGTVSTNRLAGILIVSLTLLLTSGVSSNTGQEGLLFPAQWQENPLWSKFQAVGQRYGLDLDFTRRVIIQKKMISSRKHILCQAPSSLDVILFGDSSLAWGTIPQIIEQTSGLKVAVVANRSMYLNVRTLKVLDRLRTHYLKPGGMTIFSYDNWTQRIRPDRIHTPHLLPLEKMSRAEFIAYADARRRSCNGGPEPGVVLGEPDFRWRPLQPKEIPTDEKLNGLTMTNSNLLGETNPGDDIIERLTPPDIPNEKIVSWQRLRAIDAAMEQSRLPNRRRRYRDIRMYPGITWLRWDARSVTMFRLKNGRHSAADSMQKAAPFYTLNNSHIVNARYLRSLPGRKAIMTPIFTYQRDYRTARYNYRKLYSQSNIEFANLGALHPADENYPIDQFSHILNEGGLVKSVLIGQWLKDNY